MSAGANYTRANIDQVSGDIAVRIRSLVADAELFKAWLDTKSGSDLVALGYDQSEVDTLVSAFSSTDGLGLLAAIYHGLAALPVAINFSLAATRLGGPATR